MMKIEEESSPEYQAKLAQQKEASKKAEKENKERAQYFKKLDMKMNVKPLSYDEIQWKEDGTNETNDSEK